MCENTGEVEDWIARFSLVARLEGVRDEGLGTRRESRDLQHQYVSTFSVLQKG